MILRISNELADIIREYAKEINEPFASPENILRHMLKLEQHGIKQVKNA